MGGGGAAPRIVETLQLLDTQAPATKLSSPSPNAPADAALNAPSRPLRTASGPRRAPAVRPIVRAAPAVVCLALGGTGLIALSLMGLNCQCAWGLGRGFGPLLRQWRTPASHPPPPCVTFRLVVVPLRGPGQSPVLPFACSSGCCFLSAAAAGALAGVISAFADPSRWCVGAVLNVAWCAVCASTVPSSWCIEDVLVVAGVV